MRRLVHATARSGPARPGPAPSRTDPSKYRDRIGRPCDDGRNGNSREPRTAGEMSPTDRHICTLAEDARARAVVSAENTFRVCDETQKVGGVR